MKARKIDENVEDIFKSKEKNEIIEEYITKVSWDKFHDDIYDMLANIYIKKISIEENRDKIEKIFIDIFKNVLSYTIETGPWSLE
jgi:hypothetical protein